MFTGMIEAMGTVCHNIRTENGARLTISSPWDSVIKGESIAVNGACLTVLSTSKDNVLTFDVSLETLSKTCLGSLREGQQVNLEQAMLMGQRFGGHVVTGHIEGMLSVRSIKDMGDYREVWFDGLNETSKAFVVPKGSVALDGMSLTINAVEDSGFSVMLIPHTLLHTTFSGLVSGQLVNVEFDYFARIIVNQLALTGYEKR